MPRIVDPDTDIELVFIFDTAYNILRANKLKDEIFQPYTKKKGEGCNKPSQKTTDLSKDINDELDHHQEKIAKG